MNFRVYFCLISLAIFKEASAFYYVSNCDANGQRYNSCDGNRKSDCYYKVLNNITAEWQLDGWVECKECLLNKSLTLQYPNTSLSFTTGHIGEVEWQGVLVNVTFLNGNASRSLRRWFIIKNKNYNYLSYDCIQPTESNDYKIDLIKVYYKKNGESGFWNSQWYPRITIVKKGNYLQSCFYTPPRIFQFSGFNLQLWDYGNDAAGPKFIQFKTLILDKMSPPRMGEEKCPTFERIPTGSYRIFLDEVERECECDQLKEPYTPDNIVNGTCHCQQTSTVIFNFEYDLSIATIAAVTNVKVFADASVKPQPSRDSGDSDLNASPSQRIVATIIVVSVAIFVAMAVLICLLLRKFWCKKRPNYHIIYLGQNQAFRQLAENLCNISDNNESDGKSVTPPSLRSNSRVLLIHENECGVDVNNTKASLGNSEHKCACLSALRNHLEQKVVNTKWADSNKIIRAKHKIATFKFPDQVNDICRLVCDPKLFRDEVGTKITNSYVDIHRQLNPSIGDFENQKEKRDSGYQSKPGSVKINAGAGETLDCVSDLTQSNVERCGDIGENVGTDFGCNVDTISLQSAFLDLMTNNLIFDSLSKNVLISIVIL